MQTRQSSRTFFQILTVVCIAGLLAVLWKQRTDLARIKKEYGQLREHNAGLQENSTLSRTDPSQLAVAPAPMQTQAPEGVAGVKTDASPPLQDTAALPPTPPTPDPAQNRLALAGTEVKPISGGLVATMLFNPSNTDPLGVVAVVVRIPKTSTARILDLAPADSTAYADIGKRVSGDGKFAIFQGTPITVNALKFGLSVSRPETADVRGTCGIGPFKLEIKPSGATARGE